ncbi:MAG TPA: hypothetical protein VEJ39_10550 [Candidatus Acidoferrales bacterium]|nr:hypothetical protein [Candidatus Acidoferrales bacterium]
MNRGILSLAAVVLAGVAFAGCAAPIGAPPLVVLLGSSTPSSLEVKLTVPVSATVVGGSQYASVAWTVTCASADCGSFGAAQTSSGASNTYTAPATPPTGGTVTITATSMNGASVAGANATITITAVAAASSLSGQYAFYLSGYDRFGLFYVAAGSVTLDGMGDVTAGEEDFNDAEEVNPSVDDSLTGTYTVGPDGRGSMVLTATSSGVPDAAVGVGGTQTLSLTVVNNNHALIEEFDSSLSSSGSLDLQTSTSATALAGAYSFYLAGADKSFAYVEGGVVMVDGAGNFTSTSDVDIDDSGAATFGNTVSGSLAGPALDAMGRGVLTYGGNMFAIYVIGPEVFRIVDIDSASFNVVGSAFGQGTGSGSFSAASLSGLYVFNDQGFSSAGISAQLGLVNADGTGNLTSGVIDYNFMGDIPPSPPAPASITAGSYTMASNGYGSATGTVIVNDFIKTYGVYLTDPALNLTDPNNSSGGGSALILELDSASLGSGVLIPQSSTAAFSGNNAFDLHGYGVDLYIDIVGQVSAASPSNVAGSGDANEVFVQQLSAAPLAGSFTADTTNVGRYTGTFDLNNALAPYGMVFYQTNTGLAMHILEDGANVGIGVFEQQQ